MTLRPSPVAGPLTGTTVIDLTRVLAGPYCTMVLADLGARVIKVESPAGGDDSRSFGPFIGERSAYFMSLNRGKESIALDLKNEADQQVFERLLEHADVLVENFRPGVLERLGYGWDRLRDSFPRLIYLALSGFGRTGPYAQRPAYDMVVQAMGGIMSLTGHPGGAPTRVGSSIGDITAGLYGVIGITAALHDRHRTGAGRMIDLGMLDCQVAILENAIARFCATGEAPGPIGARHPSITPFASFPTRDGHVVVACGNDLMFGKFATCLERTDLAADPRFADNDSRTHHVEALTEAIEAETRKRTSDEWLALLLAAGIPCGPINNMADLVDDPHVAARNMLVDIDDPRTAALKVAGNPLKVSGLIDPTSRGAAPDLDADRESIVEELDHLGPTFRGAN